MITKNYLTENMCLIIWLGKSKWAGKEGSRFFPPNLSIFEIEKYFKPLFGSLELQFYWQKNFDAKIGLLNSGHSAYLLHGLILV